MRNTRPKFRPAKRIWILLLLSILVFALVEGFDLLSYQSQWRTLPDAQRFEDIRLLLSILFWPLLPLGLYLLYTGVRTLQDRRFPPPGIKLLRQHRLETGRAAVIRGWVMMFAGISLGGLAIYGAVIVPGELAGLMIAG